MNPTPSRNRATPLVSLSNAGVRHGTSWSVRGVTFDVRSGEIVTMIGPNGSGKSTTAKLALGVLSPDIGSVFRDDAARVGYVPQKLVTEWTLPLTVRRLMNLTSRPATADIDYAMERTGVAALKNADVKTLSGGELQRVLLSRAIAMKPDFLVLDEPTQGVDLSGAVSLYELIAEIRDELDCGVLIISHDLHLVMSATDKVICLNGHMCCSGTPRSVSENIEYQRLFGVPGASALAVYEHQHDHIHLPDGRVQHKDGSITEHCHPDDGHHHPEMHSKLVDLKRSSDVR